MTTLVWSLLAVASLADTVNVTPEEMALIRAAEQERVESIEKVYGTVVAIQGEDKKGGGSGVLFDARGFALTNHHVVAAIGKKGKAGLSDGKLYSWHLVGTDPAGDIAVIQLHGRDQWPIAKLGDSTKVRRGDWVTAFGNPFNLANDYSPTVTLGIVSGTGRYQGGGMVYGNCIQVDSAINPGNSGGPLINKQGEVIGINGRAAFADRGRVSVGVGFAVSIEQVRNFIPDLMASKVAQHGTLDAQFGMRDGRVVCEAINLDSRAARAGLRLGDRLISVNGESIDTANQLANVLSMIPGDWPIHVRYEHEGKEFALSIRLSALTFTRRADRRREGEEEPSDSPKSKEPQRRRPGLGRLLPGSILSPEINRANAKWIFERWQRSATGDGSDDLAAIQWKADDKASDSDKTSVFTNDGRFFFDDGKETVYRTANGLFVRSKDAEPRGIAIGEALRRPGVLAVAMQAARYNASVFDELGTPNLDGGDFVNGQPTYRIRFKEKLTEPLFVWLSLESPPKLLKAALDKDGTLSSPAISFREYTETKHFSWSRRQQLVTGVASKVQSEWIATSTQIVDIPKLLKVEHDAD